MRSNFEKVREFNVLFGVETHDTPYTNVTRDNPHLTALRFSLIDEEAKEFDEAVANDDYVEMADALADLEYVVQGAGVSFGINLDKLYQERHHDRFDIEVDPNVSNFNKIKSFYVKNYMKFPQEPLYQSIDQHRGLTRRLSNIIRGEVNRLKDHIDNHNFDKIGDSLIELLRMTNDAALQLGMNLDEVFSLVHDSNMSKSCLDEETARQTVEWYKTNDDRYDTPAYRESDGKWVIFNESTGKVLKSIKYHPVDLKTYFDNQVKEPT